MNRQSESWLAIIRNGAAALSLALIVVVAVMLAALQERDLEITEIRGYEFSGTTGRWRDETYEALLALDRFEDTAGADGTRERLVLTIDILWNRIGVLEGGWHTYHADLIDGAAQTLARSRDLVSALDRDMAGLSSTDRRAVGAIRRTLTEMLHHTRALTLRAQLAHAAEVARHRDSLHRSHLNLVFALCALATSVAILIGMLVVQSRRLARSLVALRTLHDEALRQSDLAREASIAKVRFLGHMSHELRTPLNAIIGFADLIRLQMFGPIPAHYQGYVDSISAGANELSRALQQILEIARLDSGSTRRDLSEFDLGTVVREAVNAARHALHGPTADVDISLPESGLTMHADPVAVGRIVGNLASNALRHTLRPGRIAIAVRTRDAGNGIEIIVRDGGTGMDRDELRAALGSFSGADHLTARAGAGIGLGLRIVQRNVELLGGSFRISSRKGIGTVAMVRLPAGRARAAADGSGTGDVPVPATTGGRADAA